MHHVVVHMLNDDERAKEQVTQEVGVSGPILKDREDWLAWLSSISSGEMRNQADGIRVVVRLSQPFQPQMISVLSAMRDLSGLPIIVHQPGDLSLTTEQKGLLRSLGFIGYDAIEADAYAFNIANYKETPDWLNPRHWAHPELWGKFRW